MSDLRDIFGHASTQTSNGYVGNVPESRGIDWMQFPEGMVLK